MQWRKFTRLKTSATGHSRCKAMLCCGRRKDNGRSVPDLTASPGRAPGPGPMQNNQHNNSNMQRQGGLKEPVSIQGDFRKVSGISSEIFRQIEAVENDHDPSTAAALDAVERRGEMIVRVLEPRCIGSRQSYESAQRFLAKADSRHTVQLVEIVKRPGQTLGLYIREGNGADRTDGVFISRIALESAVYNSGCLRVSDEILAVNLVDVTKMSLDDVVIIMSIPRRLVLAIRTRRGRSSSPPQMSTRSEQKQPVVVIKRDLRDDPDMLDEPDHMQHRPRSSRERRTGDGREMNESRSRLGLGLTNYSPQSEQIDLHYSGYNSRSAMEQHTPSWGYKAPAPPSVITEQPKQGSHQFQHSANYYANAGTLESLAEKVHSLYPGPNRRMSDTRAGVPLSQSHQKFPRSGSADILPRVEYTDYANSLGRHSLLRSSLKSGAPIATGGTLGRYGRYDQSSSSSSRNAIKYSSPASSGSLSRQKPQLDYSSDTEATIGRQSYYYYNQQQQQRPAINTLGRGSTAALGGGPDFAKFNSLPRDRNLSNARLNLRSRLADRLGAEDDGNLSAPEYSLHPNFKDRGRGGLTTPSIFTSDEYRAWLRRAPSSSAICEQMRASRDILNQQRAQRFSCSAENIHDALKNTTNIYSNRPGLMGFGTLDRNTMGLGIRGGLPSMPVRSLSSQHIGGSQSAIRSPNIRRMRQLLELSAGAGNIPSPGTMSGHQSPAPTPSTTLPRNQRQIDINPAEFTKYKLEKPMMEALGISGMLWFNLLAGRGLRATPEGIQTTTQVRDLYCVLECDRIHKARTVVRSGDLQFDWDETFELDLVNNKQLDVLVYSWDPQHRHKLCYRGAISIPSLMRTSPIHQLAVKVEPRGTIYIRIRYTDPTQLYRRRGIPAIRGNVSSGLFGVDLETVVTREAKGALGSAPVPIILRRCIEEIERRGLDIIGLYRLCGSATKKRLLREAFERNSRAVDLSPEHVPDINVITGVLKDYLRELPEPLFTRCLFQMTVDALGVCLPDDPEGNAKLMLSILDCLPRANRATLVFLLDHLSLVVSASDRNKMSAQALATALGPPLMLHSSGNTTDEVDHAQPIAVLKYLLQIWPQPQSIANNASGMHRRGEQPIGQRGNKANALQVAKQQVVVSAAAAAITPTSLARTPLSATANNPQYQSAVAQLAQSHRVSQPVAQTSQSVVSSASLAVPGQSAQQQLAITSPSSSSGSSSSEGTGSGTETIKRGASPTSISEKSTVQQDSIKSNSSKSSTQCADQQSTNKAVNSSSTPSSSNINNKSSNDEINKNKNKSSESSSSGPSTSTKIQSYDKPTFSKPDIVTATSTSSGYKPFSNISTLSSRSSSIERLLFDADIDINSVAGRLINSSSIASIEDEIMYIKPNPSANPTKTVKVRTSNSKETTVTNNFKLPPFPVYIPSSDIPSLMSSRTNSISNVHSKLNSPDSSYSSGTIAFNATLTNRLSALASTTASAVPSSPSRTINNYSTSTLPLKLGRNNPYLYHSESNNTTSNEKSASTAASSSNSLSTSGFSSSSPATSSYTNQNQSNYNNIYSTLPKTTSSYISKYDSSNGSENSRSYSHASSPFSKYSNSEYYSNISTTSTTNTNGTSTYTSSNHNNVFKVQYSATNPFLDELNSKAPTSNSTKVNDNADNMSSIFRNSVSETRKKFEKLDSAEDLK